MSSKLPEQSDAMVVPVIRVNGPRSNVGKTTLIERIIPMIAARGMRVATIKHTHHGFDLDHRGKDSQRHQLAGAVATVLIGPASTALLLHNVEREELAVAVGRLAEHADIILAEGFRAAAGMGYNLQLAPDATGRLVESSDGIIIGVLPDELTSDELKFIVDHIMARLQPA